MEFCVHSKDVQVPSASTKIYKDECTLCFDKNLRLCASCWDGSCKNHYSLHFNKTNHPIFISLVKYKKKNENKIIKLQVKEDKEEFEMEIQVECKTCERSCARENLKDSKVFFQN